MRSSRIISVAVALALATFVGCANGADEEFQSTDSEIITQPGTETVEITVPTTDTLMIERTVETDIDVDVDTTLVGQDIEAEIEEDATTDR